MIMAKKVAPSYEMREVRYTARRWAWLWELREMGMRVMEALEPRSLDLIVHGSAARGDVGPGSDVDLLIPEVTPSMAVEGSLAASGIPFAKREIAQATPAHAVKAIIHIDEKVKLTFPLVPLRGRERDFYRFGGEIGIAGMRGRARVAGVDKRLMLIVPTDFGHCEASAVGNEQEVARTVGVGVETVEERVRVLTRRDSVGRTGVYFKEEVSEDETFEGRLAERAAEDPSLRRLLQRRGGGLKY